VDTIIITPRTGHPFPFKQPAAPDAPAAVEALAMCAKARAVAERRAVVVGVRVAAERDAERQEVAA